MSEHRADKTRPTLQPSSLGKFIQLNSCSRYFDFRFSEDGFDAVNHPESPHTFPETFLEDNIIEKQHGNVFEQEVFDTIASHVPTVIDIDKLTLNHVLQTIPDKTRRILTTAGWEKDPSHTDTQHLSYHGVAAEKIRLSDPEPLIEAASELHADSLTPEAQSEANQQIENALFRLRDAYTQHLFEYLTTELTQHTHDREIPFPFPIPQTDTQTQDTVTPNPDPDPDLDLDLDLDPETETETAPIVIYQPSFSTTIGNWPIAGDADAVVVWPAQEKTDTRLRVIDVKMATEEQTHHQIQTTIYATAISQLEGIQTETVEIEAGVITQSDNYLPVTPDELPQFSIESRQADIERITAPGQVLDTAWKTPPEETEYQLDSKCTHCQYNEVCYVDTVEKTGLELLGIGRGMQRRLRNNGVTDLNALAQLAENASTTHALQSKPWDVDPRESLKPDVTRRGEETYNRLAEIPGLGEQLPELIEKAQSLLTDINPDHRNVRGNLNKAQFISGTGEGNLPTDAFLDTGTDNTPTYKPGSLIRVYINIQHDHIRDKISGVGFHATATASETDGISWARIDETMPQATKDSCQAELDLLSSFSDTIQSAIQSVATGIDFSGTTQSDPFIHVFTFTDEEKQLLEEKLSLYLNGTLTDDPTLTDAAGMPLIESSDLDIPPSLHQLRTLLGMRGGESQQMVSAISEDIKSRFGVSAPTTGLMNIYSEFFPKFNTDERFERTDWSYTPPDPERAPDGDSEIDLSSVFRHGMFNNTVPYERTDSGIRFQIDGGPDWSASESHTVRVRTGARIPLAYLWAASGRITDDWVSNARDEGSNAVINPYRYHGNGESYTQPITPTDVEALLKRMCECTRHVEQGILIKSPITPEQSGTESEAASEDSVEPPVSQNTQ